MLYTRHIFFLWLLLVGIQSFLHASSINPVDSLKNVIADCKPEEQPQLYLDLVKEIRNSSNNLDSMIHYLEKALISSSVVKDDKCKAEALRLLASQSLRAQEYAKAEEYFAEGIDLARANLDTLGLADFYYTKSRYHFSKADHEGFVSNILEAIDLYDALEDWNKKGMALISLGIQYARINEIKLALEKLNEAEELESYFTEEVQLYLALNLGKNTRRLSVLEEDDELLAKAIEILEKGKTGAENASIKYLMGEFYLALLDSYSLLDPPVYSYDLAEKAIELGKETDDQYLEYQGYLGQAHMYNVEGRYKEALRVRAPMEDAVKKLDNPVYFRSFNNINYEVSKALNRNGEALYYLEQLKMLNDSILDVERTSQFNEIVEKYENEKKQQEIIDLSNEKEKLMIKNELSASQVRVRNLWLGILAIISLSGIGLVYIIQRQKRSEAENRSLQIEQQLLRAQMNPHFIFNSLNGIKRFYIEGRTEDANDFLADFSTLLRTILDRSDKTDVTVEGEVEFLQLYLELEKRRLNDKLDYEINFDPDSFEYDDIIPSFIIQPLVENAIWHGLSKKDGMGKIKVNIRKNGDKVIIQVIDNGIGINGARSSKSLHQSKGLNLIRERLGNKGTLELNDLSENHKDSKGTMATLNIQLN
jgi:tetratricopeptide (TPR) repeat protein